ncbi:MAG TPA: phosphate-starvation-inducible PsiE family protein [Actinomycetota bacterium]|nr:phosphate-starvation-inducible PsiE family protein [Actinomycetota bacterium]
MRPSGADQEHRDRSWIAALLGYGEFVLDAAVAVALSVGGVILLSVVVYDFARGLGHGRVIDQVLGLLSGLLLVFIFTELIHTIRVVIARRAVEVEPFLIVGIVAAVRRLIVISAEAENLLGTARFRDLMLEIGVLAGTVVLLGTTVLLLRASHRRHGEPPTGPAGDH